MSAEIMLYLTQIKGGLHPSQCVALANAKIAAAKFVHGEKVKTENVNINIDVSVDEWRKRLRKDIGGGRDE